MFDAIISADQLSIYIISLIFFAIYSAKISIPRFTFVAVVLAFVYHLFGGNVPNTINPIGSSDIDTTLKFLVPLVFGFDVLLFIRSKWREISFLLLYVVAVGVSFLGFPAWWPIIEDMSPENQLLIVGVVITIISIIFLIVAFRRRQSNLTEDQIQARNRRRTSRNQTVASFFGDNWRYLLWVVISVGFLFFAIWNHPVWWPGFWSWASTLPSWAYALLAVNPVIIVSFFFLRNWTRDVQWGQIWSSTKSRFVKIGEINRRQEPIADSMTLMASVISMGVFVCIDTHNF